MTLRAQLRLFYLYRLLATSYLYTPIFLLFEKMRGLSFFEQLALGSLYSGVVIAVQIPTGVFADRYGRRRSMIGGAGLMVVSCVVAVASHGFAAFAVAEVLAAISMAACSGADSAYLYDLLASHGRRDDYAARESTASGWHLAGMAIACAGGGALAQIDLQLPYVATAVTAAVAMGIAFAMTEAPLQRHDQTVGGDITSALVETLRSPRLAWLVGYSAVVFTLVTATKYVYQPYLDERGLGPFAIGALYAGGNVIGAFVAVRTQSLRRRFGDDVLLWGILAALAISFLGLAGAARGPWMLGLLAIQAVATGLYSPLTKPLLNAEIAESGRRASLLSVESMARRAAMGVFTAFAGLYTSSDVMFVCGGLGIAGFVVLAVTRVRRRLPAADPR
jgi:predicted MFS family arabinose efflux permease